MPTKPNDSLFSRIFKSILKQKKKIKKPKIGLNPKHPTAKAIINRQKRLDAVMKQ